MGCDIHSHIEVREGGKWLEKTNCLPPDSFRPDTPRSEPFDWRSYSIFAFLAWVRNYDHCEPISEPRGVPDDMSPWVKESYETWDSDGHNHSWLSLKELLDFDYDKTFWNRRVMKNNNWASLAEEWEGKIISYRDNLMRWYFDELEAMEKLWKPEDVRIVFWFDN